ncbi:MAG: hypothetical protein SGARI_007366, partial [Bacillariaceae sp.]
MADSIEFVVNVLQERKNGKNNGSGEDDENAVTLQDAWAKRMELPKPIMSTTTDDNDDDATDSAPPPKRARTTINNNHYKPYYKARYLFHPNRKTHSMLLPALRQKGARLIRPGGGSNSNRVASSSNAAAVVITAYLEMDFGKAFTMTIYLSPLTVTIRAMMPPQQKQLQNSSLKENKAMNNNDLDGPQSTDATVSWKPLSYGLEAAGSSSNNKNGNGENKQGISRELSVWGVSATYDAIGHVVEERLRDASTHATYLLRKCFQNHVKDKSVDYEVEMLEGSALLQFLQVARETYMPQWQDN